MSAKLDESYLKTLELPAGTLAVDCGASVGDVTAVFREKGLRVHSFEPNPLAFAHLKDRFAGDDMVTCHQAAISGKDGRAQFYPHEDLSEDSLETANGSSLLEFKSNVLNDQAMDVDVIDLARFIDELGCEVEVLKIDIEGAEIEAVNRLLDTGSYRKAKRILVETHERKIHELREPTEALRKRIEEMAVEHIRLDWH
jgi:FkbM family methyltransferase